MYILMIVLIAILASVSFSILGSYLVLKKMSMVSDAISHTVLFGIVVSFLIVKDLNSPFLILGASLVGVLTVLLINLLSKVSYITKESAIGIVMTFFFSLSIILISLFAYKFHLDNDSVLMGDITFASLDTYFNIPKSILLNLILIIINSLFVYIFYKEINVMLFDLDYAKSIKIPINILDYILIFLLSLTTVSNFSTMGSILIVSLMIGPPSIASLYSKSLKGMIFLSILISSILSFIATILAIIFNVSIAGSIATIIGLTFLICISINKRS